MIEDPRTAPDSFTVRAADSDETSAVANAARVATVVAARLASRGPNADAARAEITTVARKNSAGTGEPEITVMPSTITMIAT